jgi:TrpR-related protein YerC/YecD
MRLSKKKITPKVEKEIQRLFYQVVADIHSPKEAAIFFNNVLTKTELEALTKRLAVAHYLEKGSSYEKIKETLKVSSATVATIAEQIQRGEGYQIAFKKVSADEWAEKWAKKLSQMIGGNQD